MPIQDTSPGLPSLNDHVLRLGDFSLASVRQLLGVSDTGATWVSDTGTITAGVNTGIYTDAANDTGSAVVDGVTYTGADITLADGTTRNETTIIKLSGDGNAILSGKINGDAAAQLVINIPQVLITAIWDNSVQSHSISVYATSVESAAEDRYTVETKTGPYTVTSADLGKLLIIDDVPTLGAIATDHIGKYVTLVSRATADITIAGTGLFGETLIAPDGVRSAVVTAVDEWQLG